MRERKYPIEISTVLKQMPQVVKYEYFTKYLKKTYIQVNIYTYKYVNIFLHINSLASRNIEANILCIFHKIIIVKGLVVVFF